MNGLDAELDWIAVDWGTSNLRVWLMGAGGKVLDKRASDRGMNVLGRDAFEPALLDLVGDALPETGTVPVLVCGMAGSRQGWAEAPYRSTPCAPPGITEATHVRTKDQRLDVAILPGIKQDNPADVMRGEETQIAGVFAAAPNFDGVICMPGTHTKWVQVSAGEVVSFATFMTGETFALLAAQSVLRHSVAAEGWDEGAFLDAVSDTMSRPAAFAAKVFGLRAEALLQGLDPVIARARLSGHLIGLELAGARPYWLGQEVVVLGEGTQAGAYASALAAQGLQPRRIGVDEITLAGLSAARTPRKETLH